LLIHGQEIEINGDNLAVIKGRDKHSGEYYAG
jgi:hypothetical protein